MLLVRLSTPPTTPSAAGSMSVYCPLYAFRPPTLDGDMKFVLGLLAGAATDEGGILDGIDVIVIEVIEGMDVIELMEFMTDAAAAALFIWWLGTPMKDGSVDCGAMQEFMGACPGICGC